MSFPRIDDLTENHGDYRIEIFYDDDPSNPREDDNLSALVCFHGRYNLGDPHDYRTEDHGGWDDVRQAIIRDYDPVVILPLFLYDHSGITIRVGRGFGEIDAQGWDWGCVGFAFVSRDKYDAERAVAPDYSPADAEARLRAEVETYDQYLRGEVFGYVVSKVSTCDHGDEHADTEDSCWGFYSVEDALSEARAAAGVTQGVEA